MRARREGGREVSFACSRSRLAARALGRITPCPLRETSHTGSARPRSDDSALTVGMEQLGRNIELAEEVTPELDLAFLLLQPRP